MKYGKFEMTVHISQSLFQTELVNIHPDACL